MNHTSFSRARTAVIAAIVLGALALSGTSAGAAPTRTAWQLDRTAGAEIVAGLPYYDRGAIVVLPSGPNGPRVTGARTITGDDLPAALDFIGGTLASGDVDGDGFGDIVTSGTDYSSATSGVRALVVIPGSPNGPRVDAAYRVNASDPGIGGNLIARDLDRDGITDVVAQSGTPQAPEVTILWGAQGQLTTERSTRVRALEQRRFGQLLAAGNVDGDRRTDLLVGQAGRIPDNESDGRVRGYLNVCEVGPARGVVCAEAVRTPAGSRSILTADVVGGSAEEVLIGEPVTNYRDDTVNRPGVWMYRGTENGIVATPVKIDRNSEGVPGSQTQHSAWGSALAAGDLDRDGKEELAVGAPGEGGGRVTILWGNRRGPGRSAKDVTFSQASPGLPGSDEQADGFGGGLSVLDVNGDGRLDLVAGVPGEDGSMGSITVIPWADGALRTRQSTRIEAEQLGLDPARGEVSLGRIIGQ